MILMSQSQYVHHPLSNEAANQENYTYFVLCLLLNLATLKNHCSILPYLPISSLASVVARKRLSATAAAIDNAIYCADVLFKQT
jgi:hypothetical protein